MKKSSQYAWLMACAVLLVVVLVFAFWPRLPANPQIVSAEPLSGQIEITWDVIQTPNSIKHYALYVSASDFSNVQGMSPRLTAGPNERSAKVRDLSNGTTYFLAVTIVGGSGGEQHRVSTVTATPSQPNPSNIVVQAFSGMVALSWEHAETGGEPVAQYAVYISDSDFSSVEEMNPRQTAAGSETTTKLAGLNNDATYYFAVTALDASGIEGKEVKAVSATPTPDTEGPMMIDLRMGEAPLADGTVVQDSATLSVSAVDPAGVSRVGFALGGKALTAYAAGTSRYGANLDINDVADGSQKLTVIAYDTFDNTSQIEVQLNVALAAPNPPQITAPTNGYTFNRETIVLSGTLEKRTDVLFYRNGTELGDPLAADNQGNFSAKFMLREGENRFQAAARNRAGLSELSAPVVVTVDKSIPKVPRGLFVSVRPGGVVRLAWNRADDGTTVGYHLYRSNTPFHKVDESTRINNERINATRFDDLLDEDGIYYYRLAAVNSANIVGEPSRQVSATVDSTPPRAITIRYSPHGNYDPDRGVIGTGRVGVELLVSEPLQAAPFLALNLDNASPLTVDLQRVDESRYAGEFEVTESTPTGEAFAVFSARDRVGNRGTEIEQGNKIKIDTSGPGARTRLSPTMPLRNDPDSPATVGVTLELDEPTKADESPTLAYRLSGEGRRTVPIDGLTQNEDDPRVWTATLVLPSDAGAKGIETLQLEYHGVDELQNSSTQVAEQGLIEIYQGNLPALPSPWGAAVAALPGGRVRLSWLKVPGAVDYQVYRQGPGEDALVAQSRTSGQVEFSDKTPADGDYRYAVASVRLANDQETISPTRDVVRVTADSVAPDAPRELKLSLIGSGIRAEWKAPPGEERVTYSLFRSSGQQIESVDELKPIRSGVAQPFAVDHAPSEEEHAYAVVAVDAAGNSSAPSKSAYLNFDLLPVATLTIRQEDDNHPVISWTHSGRTISGYDVYHVDAGGAEVKLNPQLIKESHFTDTGYGGDERHYAVAAVDHNGVSSIRRSLLLRKLRAEFAPQNTIERGVFNRLEYQVANESSVRMDNVRLRISLAGVNLEQTDNASASFSLDVGQSRLVPIIIPGHKELPDQVNLATTIEAVSDSGEKVEIARNSEIEIWDNSLVLELLTENFTRGGSGKVRFTLHNMSGVEVDVVTARNGDASDEVFFKVLDHDDNVLAVQPFKQASGDAIIAMSDGIAAARIGAGAAFISQPIEFPIPLAAPRDVRVELDIKHVHYHLGQNDAARIEGLSTRRPVPLIDTAYFGEIADITPARSFGDENVVISGRAVERRRNRPLPNVPLNLVIRNNGFERTVEAFTDGEGEITHEFEPLSGESGEYKVSMVHPDLLDRPDHGQFVISRVFVDPPRLALSIPKNRVQEIPIRITAGEGTTATNLRLVYLEDQQLTGSFPQGIEIRLPKPVALNPSESQTVNVLLSGDETARQTGAVMLTVRSDEGDAKSLASVAIRYTFSEARPALVHPSHIETGVQRGESTSETLELENRGLAALKEVRVALLDKEGLLAPDWVFLTSPATLGSLAVGERRKIQLLAQPPTSVPDETYEFVAQVSAANHRTVKIPVYVSVTQSDKGNVLFKVSDIYTGTMDEQTHEYIKGLAGAQIEVQRAFSLDIERNAPTNDKGELWLLDLPVGRYEFRASAPNHQPTIGLFQIKPGITVNKEVFLDDSLVTVQWSVNETTIQDRYEITLQATYETNVPAPVMKLEPILVNLPMMRPGDVYRGEFTLTNLGLVRADNLRASLPTSDQYIRYDFLRGIPEALDAKSRITVPYRAVCLRSFDLGTDGEASGGGCFRYAVSGDVSYTYKCANGYVASGSAPMSWVFAIGSDCGGGAAAIRWVASLGRGGGGGGRSLVSFDLPVDCLPKLLGDCIKNQAAGNGPGGE